MGFESESGRFGQGVGDSEQAARERADLAIRERFEDEVVEALERQAISTEAFVTGGAVTRAERDADNKLVEDIKTAPEFVEAKDYEAKILEFVLQKMFDDGVFGDVVKYTIKTSEYDDKVRGIDFYVDIGEEEERVLVGIDATVSRNPDVLAKKIDRNVSAITHGKMPGVKYYMDIDGNLKVEKSMPRVILGLDRATTARLRDAILEGSDSLENDNVVKLLIGQMVAQLELLYNIARPQAKRIFARALQRLDEMCIEKGLELDGLTQAFRDDLLANPQRLLAGPSRGRFGRRAGGESASA